MAKPSRRSRDDELNRELAKIRAQGRWNMANALATGGLAIVLGLGTNVVDKLNPPSPTTETRSECASAFANVKEAIDIGIDSPELLENVNPEGVDESCGEESAIAEDLTPTS